MTETENAPPDFAPFAGTWILDPASCKYEQGEPPRSEGQTIRLEGATLVIEVNQTDADGVVTSNCLRVPADGTRLPFKGGPLADEIGISWHSSDMFSVSAWRAGVELMTADRKMSADGQVMILLQRVNLPDGSAPENRAEYRRQQ